MQKVVLLGVQFTTQNDAHIVGGSEVYLDPGMKRSRIKPINKVRKERKYRRNFKGPFDIYDHSEWIRQRPCCVPGCGSRTEAAHIIPRGMGGAKGTWRHLVPLCRYHHNELDIRYANKASAFHAIFNVDLIALAARYSEEALLRHEYDILRRE